MSDKTAIAWTDSTWNPVTGCTRVSPGCDHCYASTLHNSRYRSNVKATLALSEGGSDPYIARACGADWLPFPAQYDSPFAQVQTWEHKLAEPLGWRRPRRVFTCSMGDLFHENVPFEFLDRVFAVMALTPQHTYQVLTKRPERMREYLTRPYVEDRVYYQARGMAPGAGYINAIFPLPNVWLGTSVEDQEQADARIPVLLETPAAVRFISAEPLLGPLEIAWAFDPLWQLDSVYRRSVEKGMFNSDQVASLKRPTLDWVIVGGESGPKARPCEIGWIRSIVGQCRAAAVPCFVKQLGSRPYDGQACKHDHHPQAKCDPAWKIKLRHSHGGNPEEWPEDLRVREFPEGSTP